MTINFSIYRARIVALQEAAITGSQSYPTFNIGASDPIYWINRLNNVSPFINDTDLVTYTITFESFLVRAPVSSGFNGDAEQDAQDDLFNVLGYFVNDNARNMIVGAYTTPPNYFVLRSLDVQGQGVNVLDTDAGRRFASRFTFTFKHNEQR